MHPHEQRALEEKEDPAPGHTDLMVPPESLDAFMEANPLPPERFFLDQDDSCHWFLVPAARRAEWEAWREILESDERSWEAPEFARELDGYHALTFTDPR